uniref:Uncharacterized protein n=1 Tax=Rhizophora mucronata TaxID=61149 RepID=A0A2P2NY99_RHIMU
MASKKLDIQHGYTGPKNHSFKRKIFLLTCDVVFWCLILQKKS